MELKCLYGCLVLDGLIPHVDGICYQVILIVGMQGIPVQVKI